MFVPCSTLSAKLSLKSSPRVGTMQLFRRVTIYLRLLVNVFCLLSGDKYYCQLLGYNLSLLVTAWVQHGGKFYLCPEINCQHVVIILVKNYLRVAYACHLAVINYNSVEVNVQFVTAYLFVWSSTYLRDLISSHFVHT